MPTAMSFETIDDLEMLQHDLCQIRKVRQRRRPTGFPSIDEKLVLLGQATDEALACVEKALVEARTTLIPELTDLSGVEGERICEFDGVLRKLTNLLQHECTKAQEALDTCLADPSDPMGDFEVGVQIDYAADGNTLGYSEDSDNYLTSRDYPMRCRDPEEPCLLSGEWGRFGQETSHCWLFYDLTDHDNGLTQPAIPPAKIYAIGDIWAEVVVRRQYHLDARTGNWVRPKRVPDSSRC